MTVPLIISFIAVINLLGCSRGPAPIVQEALEFWKANNYERLYNLASAKLKSELPRDFFLSQANKMDFPLILTHKIASTEEDGDRARVEVAITIPDFTKMSTETSAALINGAISEKQIQEILQNGTTEERLLNMELSRKSGGWRIEKFKPFETALYLHQMIMSAQAYKGSIKIVSINASKVDPQLGEDLVIVEGKISNNGSEMLVKVEVTVRFKDGNGKVLHEAKVYPLLITGCTSADVAEHMQNSGEFRSYINVPVAWAGEIEGNITDLELGSGQMGCGGASHASHH